MPPDNYKKRFEVKLMRTILRYENGLRVDAVLLFAGAGQLRLAIDSRDDTAELLGADGCWRAENGEAVEIEALMPIPGTEVSRPNCEPKVLAAGGGHPYC
jgi:hypothetical protein